MLNIIIIFNIAASAIVVSKGDTVEYFSPQHDGPVNYKLHDLYKDGIRIENKSAISFQVKCEKNAYLLLQEHRNDYKNFVVEVIFGSLGLSISDKRSHRSTWCNVPNILSKYQYRKFWISWKNDVIRVGRGFIPSLNTTVCKETTSSIINFVSIGTAGNISGYWKFNTGETFMTPSVVPVVSTNKTLTPYIGNTTVNPNEKSEDNLTAVYIAVPVLTVTVLLVVIGIILYRRYRGSHFFDKIKHKVDNNAVTTTTAVTNRRLGVENPVYNEHVIENQDCLDNDKNEAPNLTEDNYTIIGAVDKEVLTLSKETTMNDNKKAPVDQLSDTHVYKTLSHTQDEYDLPKMNKDVEEVSGDDANYNAYSYIECVEEMKEK